jgi:uroporphyrinogen-III synthase
MSLEGATILVTRSPGQAASMASMIEERGGIPVLFPALAVGPPPSWDGCDAALARLSAFDAVVFPSVNAVDGFLARCRDRALPADALRRLALLAIGPATRRAVERGGYDVLDLPEEFSAAGLIELLRGMTFRRVLLPRGTRGRAELVEGLMGAGLEVEPVEVYHSGPAAGAPAVRERLLAGGIDVLTFASPSAVEGIVAAIEPATLADVRRSTVIAVIGPTTLEAVRRAGADADVVPRHATIPAMLDAIEQSLRRPRTTERTTTT